MNILDIILLCIVAVFAIRGSFRGLVQEVMSLVAIILAVYLAANFNDLVAPHIQLYIDSDLTVGALSYAVVFFGVIAACWILAKFVRSALEISLLGWLDRSLGALFGFIEGVVVGLILLMFLHSFASDAAFLKESTLAPRAEHLMRQIKEYTPQSMQDMIDSGSIELPTAQEAIDSAKEAVGIESGDASN